MHTNTNNTPIGRITCVLLLLIISSNGVHGQSFSSPPTMDEPDDVFIGNNSGEQTINLTGISNNDWIAWEVVTVTANVTSDPAGIVQNLAVNRDGNASTGTVTFDPAANTSGQATITITLEDPDGSTDYEVLVVVNDPPVVDIPDQEIAEGTANFTLNLDDFVSDPDTDDESITWTYSGNSDLQVSIDNSTRVATITPPDLEWNGTETITFTANDNVENFSQEGSDDAQFTVTAVNDTPVLANIEGDAVEYTEGDDPVQITAELTVADVDNSNLTSAEVAITSNFVKNEDVLSFSNANNITGSYNSGKGILELSGESSVANYQAALRSVTYHNTNEVNPNTNTRTISFTVNDGEDDSNTETRDINILSNNDAPVLADIENNPLTFTEGDDPVKITSGIKVSDEDNPNLQSAVVSISSNYIDSEDVLAFTNANGITGSFDEVEGKLTLTGESSASNYQKALRTVTYHNTNDVNPDTGTRTISFTVNDGEENSNTVSRDINIEAVNSAPVLADMESTTLNFTEGDTPVSITEEITVSDADNANLSSATIKIASNFKKAEDVLAFTNANGISGSFNADNGTLTLSGSTALADYQTALRNVTYQNTNNTNPNTATRIVQFTVNDGTSNSNTVSRNISIATVNNAPTASDTEIVVEEDKQYTFASSLFTASYSDPEGDDFNGIKITSLPDEGLLTHNGSNVAVNSEISPADIKLLKYAPAANGNGSNYASFTFQVIDNQGAYSGNYTVTVDVTAIPDTPNVTNATANEGEQTTSGLVITKNAADGDEVTHFKIINIQKGTLYQNNGTTEIANNAFITVAQGGSGLKFTPNSASDGSFEIQASTSANDSGVGGGVAMATISVNSKPYPTNLADITVQEDAPDYVMNLGDIYSDDEDADDDLTFEVITNSNPGLFTSVDISGTSLIFDLANNANGKSSITLRCTDTDGAFVENSFDFTITPVNDPPAFTLSTNKVDEGENFAGNITVDVAPGTVPSDEVGQKVTYSLNPASVGFVDISINSSTGRITIKSKKDQSGSQVFEVIANDGQSSNNIYKRNLTVTIGDVNNPPVFALSGDVTANEDFTGSLNVTVTPETVPEDEQNQTVTYSISPTTISFANMSFDPATGNVSFTSVANRNGSQTFTITANDGQSENNTYSDQFLLTINKVNDPPTIDDIPDMEIAEGAGTQEVTLTGITGGPFENDASQYPIKIFAYSGDQSKIPNPTADNNPIIVPTSTQTTAKLTFKPNASASGTVTIQVLVIDAGQQTTSKNFMVSISDRNDPPFFDEIASPVTIDEDATQQSIGITGISAGPGESQVLSFSVTSDNEELIGNATVDYNSPASVGILKFKPNADAAGTVNLTVTLTDDGQSDGGHQNTFSRNVEVIVNPVNDSPVITSEAILFATAEMEYTYTVVVDDPDEGDNITIESTTALPEWLTFVDNGDKTATFSGTPSLDDIGISSISIKVTDEEGLTDTQSFSLEVIKENKLPTFTSVPDTIAAETFPYSYTVTVEDEDVEDNLTITAIKKPVWLSLTNNASKTALLNGRPIQGDAGDYEIVLKVTDSRGGSAEQAFTLNVLPLSKVIQLSIETEDLTYDFGKDSILVTDFAEIFKFDEGTLSSARITIQENYIPGADSLSAVLRGGLMASFRNGVLTIEGEGSIAEYEEVLSAVYYHNKNNPASTQPKLISFQVSDINLRSNAPARRILFEEVINLDIPNAFTPNDDGDNDQWVIKNINPEAVVQIYARSGSKIYESKDYYQSQLEEKAWDGKDQNGKDLPSGVYYYFIDTNKYGTSYKGTVTILK